MPAHNLTVYGTYTLGIDEVRIGGQGGSIYLPDGRKVNHMRRGMNIVRGSDGRVRKVLAR